MYCSGVKLKYLKDLPRYSTSKTIFILIHRIFILPVAPAFMGSADRNGKMTDV